MIVMVIDDSITVRMQAGRALVDAGYKVVEAVDGLDALEKLGAGEQISLIFCDVNMPGMSGLDFLTALARRGTAMPPVVMLTTEGHPKQIQQAKASGAKGWMMKPFKPELLIAAARKLIVA